MGKLSPCLTLLAAVFAPDHGACKLELTDRWKEKGKRRARRVAAEANVRKPEVPIGLRRRIGVLSVAMPRRNSMRLLAMSACRRAASWLHRCMRKPNVLPAVALARRAGKGPRRHAGAAESGFLQRACRAGLAFLTLRAADFALDHGACKARFEETSEGKRQAPRQARRG